MKLIEEVGEVAEVLNQLEGRKKIRSTIASINNIDLTSAIIEKDKKAAIKYDQSPNLGEFRVTPKDTKSSRTNNQRL